MFGWVDFREDGKKRVENRRENGWEGCLDERGRRREKWWGPAIFSLGPPQFNLSKMGRKWGRKGRRVCWTKLPFSLPWPIFCLFLLLSFRSFFVLFLFFFFFCLDKISSGLHNTFTLVLVFFFWIKFCTVDVGSFCLFVFFFF